MAAHQALACMTWKPPQLHCIPCVHRYLVARHQREKVPVPTVRPGAGAAESGGLQGHSMWQVCHSMRGDRGWFPSSNTKCQALLCSHVGRSNVAGPPGLLSPLHITLGAGKHPLLTQPASAIPWAPLLGTHRATLVPFNAKFKFVSL